MRDKQIREAFGEELSKLGYDYDNVVMVSGDLEDSTKAKRFHGQFPDRFFSVGIAEQDMVGTAVGLALSGYIAFVNSFAVFLTNRAYDAIRMLCCLNKANVKLCATHAGLTVGLDGASAQCLEDIAIMRALPNMVVICPCDEYETRKAVRAAAEYEGPVYLRFSREAFPKVTTPETEYKIGKAVVLKDGNDVTIFACGIMVAKSMNAAKRLEKEGISAAVVNIHTIKPIDRETILEYGNKTGAAVTAEEHQVAGGMGSAVSEVLIQDAVIPIEMVGVEDSFGESGQPEELLEKYGLTEDALYNKVKRAISRKK